MKTVWSAIALVAITLSLWLLPALHGPAMAADIATGAKVFSANCAACHMGGGNVINSAKTLKQGDLEKYAMNSAAAIVQQVTAGKMAMPAFGGRLTEEQIEAVAAYVLDQAEKGW